MDRQMLSDLAVFLAVAEESSFTRAAAKLGTSQAAVSQTIRRLEDRSCITLFNRTTRSLALSQAGEKLLDVLSPSLGKVDSMLTLLSGSPAHPAGLVRITCSRHSAVMILWPAIDRALKKFPELRVELSINSAFVDIVTDRFDAGVRQGKKVEGDMDAIRIGPDFRLAVVGAPAYFAEHPAPSNPRELSKHMCINMRLPSIGSMNIWDFKQGEKVLRIRVGGKFIANDVPLVIDAALEGHGLAYVMEDQVLNIIEEGRLVRILDDWCHPQMGYHLYFPDQRQVSPSLAALIEELRYRE